MPKKAKLSKKAERYLGILYPVLLQWDKDGVVASHPDLPGCIALGKTVDLAMNALDDSRFLWITTRIEDGLLVPKPSDDPMRDAYVHGLVIAAQKATMRMESWQKEYLDHVDTNNYDAALECKAHRKEAEWIVNECMLLIKIAGRT